MGTILVAAVVFGVLGYTIFRMICLKKKGGACIGCPAYGSCTACSKKAARS
jgi:hypothetical protein